MVWKSSIRLLFRSLLGGVLCTLAQPVNAGEYANRLFGIIVPLQDVSICLNGEPNQDFGARILLGRVSSCDEEPVPPYFLIWAQYNVALEAGSLRELSEKRCDVASKPSVVTYGGLEVFECITRRAKNEEVVRFGALREILGSDVSGWRELGIELHVEPGQMQSGMGFLQQALRKAVLLNPN
jgi:hypothetical protein